jgi:hypothetical protein
MVNLKALQIIETVFLGLSATTFLTASQFWLYRFGYNRGYGIGKHCGMTEGLYKAKQRESMRLTAQQKNGKMTQSWENSTTQARSKTSLASSTR